MKQNQNRKVLSTILCIAVISVFSLTIAYAVLSETLTISGSGTVNASNWNIAINNSTTSTNATTGTATYTTPTINGTTISYGVSFTKPSDAVSLYFDISNTGDITGEITSIITSTPTCTSVTGNTADAKLVCDNLEITLTYSSGREISVGDIINSDGYVCWNGYSSWVQNSTIKVEMKLKDEMTSLPSGQVNITNIKHDIIFSQTEKTCSNNPMPV